LFCTKCGTKNSIESHYCGDCGHLLQQSSETPDLPHDISKKVERTEYWEAAVGYKNTDYYLTQFQKFANSGVSASWNWPAFFITFYWLLYRKMWLYALAFFIFPYILLILFGIILGMSGSDPSSLIAGIFWLLYIGISFILIPIYANGIYYRRVENKIAAVKVGSADNEKRLRILSAKGGTSSAAIIVILVIFIPAIIGTLAAIAIPAYQDYTVRAQISEGLTLAASAKASVAESFSRNSKVPANRTEAGMTANATDTKGIYVESVEITNGTITIMYGNQANEIISGETLSLIPYETDDLSVIWRCGNGMVPTGTSLLGTAAKQDPFSTDTGGRIAVVIPPTAGILDKYVPAACRP
jgi:Tfp pilus assembly major pilin PilA